MGAPVVSDCIRIAHGSGCLAVDIRDSLVLRSSPWGKRRKDKHFIHFL